MKKYNEFLLLFLILCIPYQVKEVDANSALVRYEEYDNNGVLLKTENNSIIVQNEDLTFNISSFDYSEYNYVSAGFSRDDAAKFLPHYYDNKILVSDPFATVDQVGVRRVVALAVEGAKSTRPDVKLGVCGEHGGDPDSIEFFHKTGLKYVSCSPYRVPIARLAAARAQIKFPR